MWKTLYKSSNSANIYNIQNKSGDTHKIHIMSNFILGHLIQDLLLSFGRKVIWSYDVMTEFRPFNNLSANDLNIESYAIVLGHFQMFCFKCTVF